MHICTPMLFLGTRYEQKTKHYIYMMYKKAAISF